MGALPEEAAVGCPPSAAKDDAVADAKSEEADFLHNEGYVVVKGVLSPEDCDELLQHVRLTTEEASNQGRNDLFGNIQEQDCRWDLKLDLCKPVVKALNEFSTRCKGLLTSFMGGSAIKVVELAAITSAPGAKAQPVHADTMHGITRFLQSELDLPIREVDAGSDDEFATDDVGHIVRAVATDTAILCSALLALQDVDEDMGPTHVWPQTNTVEHHATLWGTSVGGKMNVQEADEAFKVQHKKMVLKKGDLVLYDSRTMHCGGANYSDGKKRSVLVISTMGPGVRPDGSTFTMLKHLRNRLRLAEFPMDLERASASTSTPRCVELPPRVDPTTANGREGLDADTKESKEIPPLEDWEAAVQCATCRQWRPVAAAEAPRFAGAERGFFCGMGGYNCMQPQKYSMEQIDAMF
eukprot:TRINITY_DN111923_c0_g1_i1.p1 TRINITY_DN111923_c0_g1~~TRINITY_DN111923_c0_g1_i1.p1  ORF type:complete len:410 (-),score=93.29 TRINITY_DN111923_c0_g1_i1:147-1376(-)